MNIEDLEEELENILPSGFHIETDKNGRIVIYTGLCQDDDGELVPFTSDDDSEEEVEIDSDFEPLEDEDDEDE